MVPMSLAPSMESKPIREVAYETLKNAIVTGEIPAGSRIVETEYAERMHISRTQPEPSGAGTVSLAQELPFAPLPQRISSLSTM